ncbi:MAG TPA: helix-turn-helix domain-containing protein [Ktedonosporobacter sp.]|nr:helix-turn-helix domain-containing protein [Ktedonosporobacter sp.]
MKTTTRMRLAEERRGRGWSQQDVADQVGTTQHNVSRWESGTTTPSPYFRAKLCELFGKSALELDLIAEERTERSKEPVAESQVSGNVPGERAPAVPAVPDMKNRWRFSRRLLMLGLIAGVGGGVAYWETLLHRASPVAPGETGALIYTYHTHPPTSVNDVKWSPDGQLIACANGDKTAQILEATAGLPRLTYREHTGFVNSLSWSPNQPLIASASGDTTVQIWKSANGEQVSTYRGHSQSVWCVAWSPDGTLLASGGRDKIVQVWEALTGQLITTYRSHTKGVWAVAWSPDGQSIASGGEDGRIRVWESLTGRESDTFVYEGNPNATLFELAWSPDGARIASANADGTVQIWDALTGGHMLTLQGHRNSVQTVKWSFDGSLLASGSLDKTVRIWNAQTGKQVAIFTSHTDEVYAVTWAPGGDLLASGSKDTTMRVHQFKSKG